MKRCVTLIVVAAVLATLCASTLIAANGATGNRCLLPFPGATFGLNKQIGNTTVGVQLLHGWVSGTAAWYSCFATNDIRTAQTQESGFAVIFKMLPTFDLTLAPKLSSAIGTTARAMYVVTNFNNNGPAFSTSPLDPSTYTGLWQVVYVTWLPGVTPWVITDVSAPAGTPPGLPIDGVQATFSNYPVGITPGPFSLPTVIDCPMFAVGPISNPWFKPTSTVPPLIYRIPQGIRLDVRDKILTIPAWDVYCRDNITRRVSTQLMILPDISDLSLAALIGANYAPTLADMPLEDRSNMFAINWQQHITTLPGSPLLKVVQGQLAVLDECPTDITWRNTNREWSPIDSFILLNRNLALISPEVLFNNVPFILQQINRGALVPVAPFVFPPVDGGPAVNAPVFTFSLPMDT